VKVNRLRRGQPAAYLNDCGLSLRSVKRIRTHTLSIAQIFMILPLFTTGLIINTPVYTVSISVCSTLPLGRPT